MLYPTRNPDRQCIDLSAFWAFKPDSLMQGERGVRSSGLPDSRPIAVPASWNNLFEEPAENTFGNVRFQNCPGDHPNGVNHKGVFTRDRRPKMEAHQLRQFLTQESEK
jgi:beta-galactosidase/beta-glucuronidase